MESFYYSQGDLQLPGDFGPPEGSLLLALEDGKPAGCGAFSRLSSESCELKRLYVRSSYRSRRIGAHIVAALIEQARRANYHSIRLETVTFMSAAIAMYRSLGFRECNPYYEIPEVFRRITVLMDLEL